MLSVVVIVVLLNSGQPEQLDENTDRFADLEPHSYSAGRDEHGYWTGLTASDYVEMFDYSKFGVPFDIHTTSEEDIDLEVKIFLIEYSDYLYTVTDRAVENNDTVNIDYSAVADGIIFTGELIAQEIIVGLTDWYEGCFEQLIGHSPGETVEYTVTLPDPYELIPDLSGKEANFTVKINHITEKRDITDQDVETLFLEERGWKTVEDLRSWVRRIMQEERISEFINVFLETQAIITTVPESLLERIELSMVEWHNSEAEKQEKTFDGILKSYEIEGGIDELLEKYREVNYTSARVQLMLQAVAEDMGLKVTNEDIREYYGDNYSEAEEFYGLPYMAQKTMHNIIFKHIIDNSILL